MPSQPSTHSYTNTQSQSILTDTQPRQLWAHIQTPTRIHVHAQPHTRAALNLQNIQSYARFIPLLEMYADNEADAACNVLQLHLRWLFYATVLTFFYTYIYALFHNQWRLKLVWDKQRLTAIFPQPVRELEGRCQRAAGGENVEWSWTTIFCRGEFHWYWTFILIHLTDKKNKTKLWGDRCELYLKITAFTEITATQKTEPSTHRLVELWKQGNVILADQKAAAFALTK